MTRASKNRPAFCSLNLSFAAARRMAYCVLVAGIVASTSPFLAVAEEPSGPKGANRDLHSIVADGVIRVAMTRFDLPGFHKTRADGSVDGLEADLARGIARALDVKVAFVTDYGSFDTVAEAVAGGHADIGISKLSQTYYRVLHLRFSAPYVILRHAMLYDRIAVAEAANGAAPDDVLRNFPAKIGVIGASAYVDFAHRNFPDAQVVPFGNWDDTIAALKEGRVQAIYRDEFEILRVLKNDPAVNIRFGAAIINDQKAFLSIAICDTCAKLQQFIDYHLREYPRNFTVDELINLASQK
jgi:polar amino acid transport system substrate-binding protein